MKFLLDTSTCIAHLRGRAPLVTRRLETERGNAVLCSVVRSDLLYGVHRSPNPAKERDRADRFLSALASLPLDDAAAEHGSRIHARLAAAGTPIGPYDVLIAGIALANDLVLVTRNTSEFARVPGLRIEDWGREQHE